VTPEEPAEAVAALERELARLAEERKELFARLAELESERSDHAMELFIMAAHELRTPLQSLVLGNELMLARIRSGSTELGRDWLASHLETQQHVLQRLEELMESWLVAPQLRAGTLPSVVEALDLAVLVRDVVDRNSDELTWAGCTLDLALDSVAGLWDRRRVDAVVTNLISNAIKYGAGKPVHVSLAADADQATIVVRDHGMGIALADQARIFERFERAAGAARVPGFGVGLWMSRALLRSMGGSLTVESAPDQGSTFTLQLPRKTHD
jgi:signal transduction histidine kinase